MHEEVKDFLRKIRKQYPHKFRLRNVLEVGSQNINGSPRSFFILCKYLGVDLMAGKGVDLVGDFSQMDLKQSFNVVISCEMLEHDKNWKESVLNMYNHLETGGLMIMTCAGPHRKEHGTNRTRPESSPATTDYYKNISWTEFEEVLPRHLFEEYVLQYARGKNDLQFYGIKHRHPNSEEIYKALLNNVNN